MHDLRIRLVRAVGAGCVAALLATTAACGGSADSGSSTPGESSSSSKGGAAEALSTDDIGTRLVDAQKKAGSFTFELQTSSGGQQVDGSGKADISGSTPATEATLGAAGQQVQVVVADGVFYLKAPVFRTEKPWLKIDPKSSSGLGSLLGQLGANADPTKVFQALGEASKVTEKGDAKVGGVETTVYDVAVPTSALGSVLGYPETLLKELPDTLTYTMYVDADDLVRRQDAELTIRGAKTSTRITFDDYGEDVSISAPPADQVTTKAPALPGTAG